MAASTEPNLIESSLFTTTHQSIAHTALLQGEILLATRTYSAWGGAVTAQLYFPLTPVQLWQPLTDYSQWTRYFPDVTRSEILHSGGASPGGTVKRQVKRLYQTASKAFLVFTAQVEIYLKVLETQHQRVQFYLESGSFSDFAADLSLQGYGDGTILTYAVQATPSIPVPGMFIEQAIRMDLPANLEQMRRVICEKA
ncbi:MAG: cyclase [Leptolyngbyaceae cyanobacterium CSU_1_3]|nr:cyclase [Leptolyngbyaceae cyanobacterium CSU_1_3]